MVKTLGIELSTQGAKYVILDSKEGVVIADGFNYEDLMHYGTLGGVLPSEIGERHTSAEMMVEAIDMVFDQLEGENLDLSEIARIKVDGMQHCTTYTNENLERVLFQLNDQGANMIPLVQQFSRSDLKIFTRETAPIWEDRTTGQQCADLTQILEEFGGIIKLTGNKAEMRFPAAQIMKFALENPQAYNRTKHVQILSAFAASILAGGIAPVDTGDGWGSNLNTLDILSPTFSPQIAQAIDKFIGKTHESITPLFPKLVGMTHYDAVVGRIANYFVERYGVNPNALILAGTGDNPATLLGAGGVMILSLGSSYTLFGQQPHVQVSNGEDNVFGYIPGKSMSLVCFTNGGKLHEDFLRKYLKIPERDLTTADWEEYMKLADQAAGNNYLMLPYLFDESVPVAKAGIKRQGFDDKDAATNIAALYLSQIAAVRLHSQHMDAPAQICMVGGAGKSRIAKRIAANAFEREVYNIKNFNYAAPLGCAIAAMRSELGISYQEATDRFVQKDTSSVVKWTPPEVDRMKSIVQQYAKLEKAN